MKPIISIRNISKSFGKKNVLKDISLDVYPGDVIGLIGPSGCGKSTVFRILVGYLKADSGKIFLDGKKINFEDMKKNVGYATQENAFYDKLTVMENMIYYARLYNIRKKNLKEYLESILDSVGLLQAKDTIAENISGGMKRRLDFAISIIHQPRIMILDEPTAGLDPLLIEQFWKVVCNIVGKEKAIIMTSHIFTEVAAHCNKVAVMKDGKIAAVLNNSKYNLDVEKKFREIVK